MSEQQQLLPKPEPEHVIAAHETFTPTRVIVLPVDESKATRHTVKWVIESLARKETDQIVLLNVRPFAAPEISVQLGYPYAPYVYPAESLTAMEEDAKRKSHKLLIDVAKEFQEKQIHVRAVALRGDPRDALEQKINTLMPSMVVMGNRGLGAFSRVLLGSVSQHLVHHSKVPVLIIPFNE
jgi:nucleotide-binding universal stress UspA family protein